MANGRSFGPLASPLRTARSVAPLTACATAPWRWPSRLAGLLDSLLRSLAFGTLGQRQELAPREANLPVAVHRDDLDVNGVALLHLVGYLLHAMVRHLGDVQKAVGARHDLDECPEVGDARDGILVNRADFRLGGETFDDVESLSNGVAVARGDVDRAVVLDVYRNTGLVDNPLYCLTARPDDKTNWSGLTLICVIRGAHFDKSVRAYTEGAEHPIQYEKPALARLFERLSERLPR